MRRLPLVASPLLPSLPLLLLSSLAAAAFAQAPVITPAGDPSVRSDTISTGSP